MRWRLALSLAVLRDQINAKYPGRFRASDGTIGDERHRKLGDKSDHNPDSENRVCAIDITDDKEKGPDGEILSAQLTLDSRTKYVIWNKMIWKARTLKWEAYRGAPHDHHVHVSVKQENADDTGKWQLNSVPPKAPMVSPMTLKRGDRGTMVRLLQTELGIEADGIANADVWKLLAGS